MTFKLERGDGPALMRHLAKIAKNGIDPESLVGASEAPAFGKYDPCIPPALLRKAYVGDHLRCDEVEERLRQFE